MEHLRIASLCNANTNAIGIEGSSLRAPIQKHSIALKLHEAVNLHPGCKFGVLSVS